MTPHEQLTAALVASANASRRGDPTALIATRLRRVLDTILVTLGATDDHLDDTTPPTPNTPPALVTGPGGLPVALSRTSPTPVSAP